MLQEADISHTTNRIFHDQPLPANTAAAVSLILLGLQMARIHSKFIGRVVDWPSTPIEDMGINHRRGDILVSEQILDRPDVVAVFQ